MLLPSAYFQEPHETHLVSTIYLIGLLQIIANHFLSSRRHPPGDLQTMELANQLMLKYFGLVESTDWNVGDEWRNM